MVGSRGSAGATCAAKNSQKGGPKRSPCVWTMRWSNSSSVVPLSDRLVGTRPLVRACSGSSAFLSARPVEPSLRRSPRQLCRSIEKLETAEIINSHHDALEVTEPDPGAQLDRGLPDRRHDLPE